jgi:hypothetical protein
MASCAEVDSHEILWLFLIFNLLSRRDFAYIGNMHIVRLLDYAYSQNMHMWDLHDYAYFQNMHILVWVDYAYHLNVHICVHMHTVFAIDVLINTSSSTTSTGVYSSTFVHVQHESPFLTTRRISTSEICACPQRNFTLRGTWYKYSELGVQPSTVACLETHSHYLCIVYPLLWAPSLELWPRPLVSIRVALVDHAAALWTMKWGFVLIQPHIGKSSW